MSGNSADRSPAKRAGTAEKDIFKFSLDAPLANVFSCLGEGKRRRVLEDVAMEKTERVFDVDRTFTFNAKAAIARDGEAILQRFFQPLVHAREEFSLRLLAHLLVVFREQRIRRVQPEKGDRLKTFRAQLWRKNRIVSKRVTINFARSVVRQATFRGLLVARVHLFVAFVAMKGAAPRLLGRIFLRL